MSAPCTRDIPRVRNKIILRMLVIVGGIGITHGSSCRNIVSEESNEQSTAGARPQRCESDLAYLQSRFGGLGGFGAYGEVQRPAGYSSGHPRPFAGDPRLERARA